MPEYPWLKKHRAEVTRWLLGDLEREVAETKVRTVYPPTKTSIYPRINWRGGRRTVVPVTIKPPTYEFEEDRHHAE